MIWAFPLGRVNCPCPGESNDKGSPLVEHNLTLPNPTTYNLLPTTYNLLPTT